MQVARAGRRSRCAASISRVAESATLDRPEELVHDGGPAARRAGHRREGTPHRADGEREAEAAVAVIGVAPATSATAASIAKSISDDGLTGLLREHASACGCPARRSAHRRRNRHHVWGSRTRGRASRVGAPGGRLHPGPAVKSMVATATVRLADGAGSRSRSIARHVPELRAAEWAERATFRDLLGTARACATSELEFSGLSGDEDDVWARLPPPSPRRAGRAVLVVHERRWCLAGRASETAVGAVWEDAPGGRSWAAGMNETTFVARPVAEPRATLRGRSRGAAAVQPGPARARAGGKLTADLDQRRPSVRGRATRRPSARRMRVPHADVGIDGFITAGVSAGRADWEGGPCGAGTAPSTRARGSPARPRPRRGRAADKREQRACLVPLATVMDDSFSVRRPRLRLQPRPVPRGIWLGSAGAYTWPETAATSSRRLTTACCSPGGGDGQASARRRTFVVDADDDDWPTLTFGAFDSAGRPGVLYRLLWGLPRHRRKLVRHERTPEASSCCLTRERVLAAAVAIADESGRDPQHAQARRRAGREGDVALERRGEQGATCRRERRDGRRRDRHPANDGDWKAAIA